MCRQKIQRERMGKIKVHIVNYHKNHRSLIADEASRGSQSCGGENQDVNNFNMRIQYKQHIRKFY